MCPWADTPLRAGWTEFQARFDLLLESQAYHRRQLFIRLDSGYTQCLQLRIMTKKLIRHGNSAALVLDKALLDLLKVQMDTPLEITTDGNNIIISPLVHQKAEATLLQALERINQKHRAVLEKLGK